VTFAGRQSRKIASQWAVFAADAKFNSVLGAQWAKSVDTTLMRDYNYPLAGGCFAIRKRTLAPVGVTQRIPESPEKRLD
jgi:hypothetical protein